MGKPRLLDPDVLNDHLYTYDWDQDVTSGEPAPVSPFARQTKARASWWLGEVDLHGVRATRETHLRRLWSDDLVGEVIARLLGTTRMAVTGKVDRMGLPKRNGQRGRKGLGKIQRHRLLGRPDTDQRSDHIEG